MCIFKGIDIEQSTRIAKFSFYLNYKYEIYDLMCCQQKSLLLLTFLLH